MLRDGLIVLSSRLKLGDMVTIRIDGHSSLASLKVDKSLEPLGILLEIGRPKNPNKNAVADKAIRELREQIIRLSPTRGPISEATLARAISHLNALIRYSGKSALELWMSRDQASGLNIQLNDSDLSNSQHSARTQSHPSSASYSSRNGKAKPIPQFKVGDMVFVRSDRSKSKARDSYVITAVNKEQHIATIQKFPMSNFRHHPIEVSMQNLYLCPYNVVMTKTPHAEPPTPNKPGAKIKIKSVQYITPTPKYSPDSDEDSDSSTDWESSEAETLNSHYDSLSDNDDNSSDTEVDNAELFMNQPIPNNFQRRKLYLKQPVLGSQDYLKPGDKILMVQGDVWNKVILRSHSGRADALNGSLYWNYSDVNDENETGGYLFPGQSWGVLRGDWAQVSDFSDIDIILPNLDAVAQEYDN